MTREEFNSQFVADETFLKLKQNLIRLKTSPNDASHYADDQMEIEQQSSDMDCVIEQLSKVIS